MAGRGGFSGGRGGGLGGGRGGMFGGLSSGVPFQPPRLFPTREREIRGVEVKLDSEEEQQALDVEFNEMIERSRNFKMRMDAHETRLRMPDDRDLDANMETLTGCVSLPQALEEPLSQLYFPGELYDALVPARDIDGNAVSLSKNLLQQQFKAKPTTMRDALLRLEKQESKGGGKVNAERRNSVTSEQDFDEDEDADDDLDYGKGYETDPEQHELDVEDESAIF
uniref:DNA-directed RNA polymerase III subunit n=1 Tax=Mucochytrium quahogii TaxID=96639 RepID=A0A7S2W5S7_9STRA|mmetsp:Transcript_13542/g.22102  ORF Transcript_13542/g.22102 Transcript_13542/m.22102 type:complete len:224 (+) Transcript_13542:489-1160(+)|eukprot:CAMPEP_0203745190 /NCGR_PEP_ID=MMETSP0098-20131031/1009_1 /ASSEMBLY_ACC=CAM_ASM_000208 /TAXON_ID=96639 /ORGANISM=" , Strain NY0313808BC1" /LENGTH=223 /DNA_ID=CAMNT_0050632901 /DNA_START=479 /DNA_END=1150 /DNA_ORIENTATION=+